MKENLKIPLLVQNLRASISKAHNYDVQLFTFNTSYILASREFSYKIRKHKTLEDDFQYDFTELENLRCFVYKQETKINAILPQEYKLKIVPITGTIHHPRIDNLYGGRVIGYCIRLKSELLYQQIACGQRGGVENLEGEQLEKFVRYLVNFFNNSEIFTPNDFHLVWGNKKPSDAAVERLTRNHPIQLQRPRPGEFSIQRGIFFPVIEELMRLEQYLKVLKSPYLDDVLRLNEFIITEMVKNELFFQKRLENGFINKCHHSLTLCEVIDIGDEIVMYDVRDFNSMLDYSDIFNEISMFVFDAAKKLYGKPRELKKRMVDFLDVYLDKTGDFDGLRLFWFYTISRALLSSLFHLESLFTDDRSGVVHRKTMVKDKKSHEDDIRRAGRMVEIGKFFSGLFRPRGRSFIVMMHGFSGTGKSYYSRKICQVFCAVRIRTDVERKRIYRSNKREILKMQKNYSVIKRLIVYEQMENLLTCALTAGWPVVLDATFLKRDLRNRFYKLADKLRVPLVIASLKAPDDVIRSRLKSRSEIGKDASEANVKIYEFQKRQYKDFGEDEKYRVVSIDTSLDWSDEDLERVLQDRIDTVSENLGKNWSVKLILD